MSIPPNIQQRDLVRLALLTCGDRVGAKYPKPSKGTANAVDSQPWRGYPR
jgi:hypothetical protein